ncbi:DNA helicase, partial [Tanacetum coccineum]
MSSLWSLRYNERLKRRQYSRHPEYHLCCVGGKFHMHLTLDPPAFIQQLLRNSHFMKNICAYNQMFAMTSFGAKVDESVNRGMGPYVFKISGQIYHWIGSLCPEDDGYLRFLQMYIYGTDNEVNNRMRHFGGLDAPGLNPEIVEGLIHVLDEHNRLVRVFRTARDRCNAGEISGFKIRLYNLGGVCGYELPMSNVLGAIVFEDGPRSRTDFDVIIEFRELILKPRNGRGDGRKVTMNAYYKYQLHSRPKEFWLLFKSGRLFQQYVVTVFCAIEQSRLDFIRKRQKDLRSDYLSGLYDAISRGDRWGIMVGSIVLLPRLTPADRADIVCRVFQQKVKDFVKFLKEVKTFGRVAAVVYTIEFQKRGLPHCHTLLWVDSKNKITDASQIDEYISAELPDPVKDPRGYKVVSELMLHGPCGAANLSAPCTQNGTCNKNFPKRFNANTFQTMEVKTNCNKEVAGKVNLCSSKFRSACEAMCLLGDDKECDIALQESAFSATSSEIRTLFAQILIYCDVADPVKLWNKHWESMQDDIPMKISKSTGIPNYLVNNPELQGYILYELEAILNGFGKFPKLNCKQKKIYDLIMNALTRNEQELLFVYGHGRTGKTFMWKTIISLLRSQGKIVLAVASSGIASLLLSAGRTAHSRFKLPLELTDESLCHVKKNTQLGKLLVETDLIIWDEAPMNDKRCFEMLDRTLRDLMSSPDLIFGGKTIILGGDFRQTLPVKKGAGKQELIVAFVAESHLWWHFKICLLTVNMRLLRYDLNDEQQQRAEVFAKWLLDIVNGETGEPDNEDDQDSCWISIPPEYC